MIQVNGYVLVILHSCVTLNYLTTALQVRCTVHHFAFHEGLHLGGVRLYCYLIYSVDQGDPTKIAPGFQRVRELQPFDSSVRIDSLEGRHSRTCVDRTDVDSYETEVKNYVATPGLYTSCRVLALYRLWTRWANNRLYRSPE